MTATASTCYLEDLERWVEAVQNDVDVDTLEPIDLFAQWCAEKKIYSFCCNLDVCTLIIQGDTDIELIQQLEDEIQHIRVQSDSTL